MCNSQTLDQVPQTIANNISLTCKITQKIMITQSVLYNYADYELTNIHTSCVADLERGGGGGGGCHMYLVDWL